MSDNGDIMKVVNHLNKLVNDHHKTAEMEEGEHRAIQIRSDKKTIEKLLKTKTPEEVAQHLFDDREESQFPPDVMSVLGAIKMGGDPKEGVPSSQALSDACHECLTMLRDVCAVEPGTAHDPDGEGYFNDSALKAALIIFASGSLAQLIEDSSELDGLFGLMRLHTELLSCSDDDMVLEGNLETGEIKPKPVSKFLEELNERVEAGDIKGEMNPGSLALLAEALDFIEKAQNGDEEAEKRALEALDKLKPQGRA